MQKKWITQIIGCSIILAIMIMSPTTSCENKIKNKFNQINESSTDWWPMFHHDLNHSGYSTSIGPNTNHILWISKIGDDVSTSPSVADGRVYLGSRDTNVYCLNAETGEKIWSYTTGDLIYWSSPAVIDGRVFIGSENGRVFCLNAETGEKIWNYTTKHGISSSPTVADGKLYIGSEDNNFYCLNAETGVKIWNCTTNYTTISSPAVADGKVYIGSGYDMYCINANTGEKIWNYTTGLPIYSSPAVAYGKIYFGSIDENIYCLNAETGAKIWNYTANNLVISSPAIADGKIYIGSGSGDGKMYCLDAETGVLIWNNSIGGADCGPAIADGKIYVGNGYGRVCCLNVNTGVKIWEYPTGGPVDFSPAVADGKVYSTSRFCPFIYCFGGPSLEINITGGFGVNAVIMNNGTANASGVEWQIQVKGGIFHKINKTFNGTINVPINEAKTVKTGLFLGLGSIEITVKVADIEKTAEGNQFFIFSTIN